jgi:hypothetical protein
VANRENIVNNSNFNAGRSPRKADSESPFIVLSMSTAYADGVGPQGLHRMVTSGERKSGQRQTVTDVLCPEWHPNLIATVLIAELVRGLP